MLCAAHPVIPAPRRLPALVLTVLALTALLGGCGPAAGDPGRDSPVPARPVQVAEVREAPGREALRLPGSLRAVRRASPAFLHAGALAERRVGLGQPVRAGEVLATLHNPSLQPGVLAAEAAVRETGETLAQLERDTARLAELASRGLVADDEAEKTRSRRDAVRESLARSEAALAEAREQLGEASLRAPFDAVVVDVHVEPGDFVTAGQPILSLADPRHLELRLDLPPGRAGLLAPGNPIPVFRVADGAETMGRLRELGVAEPGRTQPVIVELEQAGMDWRPGEPVYAVVGFPGSRSLYVPIGAIVNPGTGRSRVFRVHDGRAQAIDVRLGMLSGTLVAVDGALEAGDRVIVSGQAMLLDGEAVRVLP
jgi:RND family efflux transporter MFP subunit